MAGERGQKWDGFDKNTYMHVWNSQVISFKMETVFIFYLQWHGSFLLSSLHLPLFVFTHHAELTLSVCTELHDSGLTCHSWERPIVYTASCVQDTFPRRLPRPYTGAERPAEGRHQHHQRQIPEPKWSMALFPSSQNFYKLPFLFWHVFLWVLTEPYL